MTKRKKSEVDVLVALGPDMTRLLIKNLTPQQVVKTCSISKEIRKSCNEEFYQTYLSEKLKVTIKPTNYTWKRVLKEIAIFKEPKFPFDISKTVLIERVKNKMVDIINYEKFVEVEESMADIPGEGLETDRIDLGFDIFLHYIGYVFGLGKIVVVYSTLDERSDDHDDFEYKVQELGVKRTPKFELTMGLIYSLDKVVKPELKLSEVKPETEKYLMNKYKRLVLVLSEEQNMTGLSDKELLEKYSEE